MFILKITKGSVFLFLGLILLSGIIILQPYLDFQPNLSQGDHGHNLYSFQQTFHGKVPFKDYWYPYGPFAPFYHSLFMHGQGDNLKSVLKAEMTLNFLAGVVCYLALSQIIYPYLAFVAAIWFWTFHPGFHYTFNHTAIFMAFWLLLYFLFAYTKTSKTSYILFGLPFLLLISLVRINMGAVSLAAYMCSFYLIDIVQRKFDLKKKTGIYLFPWLIIIALSFLIYWSLIQGLSAYAKGECIPYANKFYYHPYILGALRAYFLDIIQSAFASWGNLFLALLILVSIFQTSLLCVNRSFDDKMKKTAMLTIGICVIFLAFTSHEYLMSGVPYRIVWLSVFEIALLFLCIFFGTYHLTPLLKVLLIFTISLLPFTEIFAKHDFIHKIKSIPSQFLDLPRASIYVANPSPWTTTVKEATQYLEKELAPQEMFFALPYEPLYYFLTGRRNPVWHVLFTEAINFSPEEEAKIIQTLDNNKINYVLLSNRMHSEEYGLGTLGQTHLKSLYQYIIDNFEPIATFGPWDEPAGWVEGHAVKLLKRKDISPQIP